MSDNKGAAIISITPEMIGKLIEKGALKIDAELDASTVTVDRFWTRQGIAPSGEILFAISGDGLPNDARGGEIRHVACITTFADKTPMKTRVESQFDKLVAECTRLYPARWFIDNDGINCLVYFGPNEYETEAESYIWSSVIRLMILDNGVTEYAAMIVDDFKAWALNKIVNTA